MGQAERRSVHRWLQRWAPGVGIDLGTHAIRLVTAQGVVVCEPSLYAIRRATGAVAAWGQEAVALLVRDGAAVALKRPVAGGALAEPEAAQVIMRDLLSRAGRGIIRQRLTIAVPPDAAPKEIALLTDLGRQAGAPGVTALPAVSLAALGAGVPVHLPAGHMVVDAGAGRCTAAVFSLGHMVTWRTGRFGSGDIDRALQEHLRRVHGVRIGAATARRLKEERAAVTPGERDEQASVRGMDLDTNLPRTVQVDDGELREALWPTVQRLCDQTVAVLAETPAELSGDLLTNGITLTGGMALLPGLADMLMVHTRCPVHISEEPEQAVARGLTHVLTGDDALPAASRLAAHRQ